MRAVNASCSYIASARNDWTQLEKAEAISPAQQRIGGTLRMGHQTNDIPSLVADSGDAVQ